MPRCDRALRSMQGLPGVLIRVRSQAHQTPRLHSRIGTCLSELAARNIIWPQSIVK